MISKNKISATLPTADKGEILTKIAEIKSKLPFLINLTRTQRSQLRKMGSKSVSYVQNCLRAGQTFPAILPPTIDISELEKDLSLYNDLRDLVVSLKSVVEGLDDTIMAAGSDAIITSDLIYGYLKQGAKQDSNIKASLEQIALHYKKGSRKVALEE